MDGAQDARLPTHIWIEAEIRRLSDSGIGVYVTARGERTGGMVIQKISDLSGRCRLLGLQRDLFGKLVWVDLLQDAVVEEREADAYISRALDRDPDLWVVEIEDKAMASVLGGALFA